jgi:replicative DNA helicase
MNNENIIKEAERQVVCQIFYDNNLYHLNANMLFPELFRQQESKNFYKLIIEIINSGEKPDVMNIADRIREDDAIEKVSEFMGSVSTEIPFSTLILILNENHKAKELLLLSNTLRQKLSTDEDIFDIISYAQSKLAEMCSVTLNQEIIIKKHIEELNNTIEKNASGKNISGVPTGFKDIDKFTGGWQAGDLVILAGRPSMGKTALAVTMIRNAGVRYDVPCALLSLEMSCLQVTARLSAMESGIDSKHLLQGKLNTDDIQRLNSQTQYLYNSKIYIDPCKNSSLEYILSACHYLATVHHVKVVYIDYLQLIKHDIKGKNQEQIIGDICKSIKRKAKELNIPIVLLSQLTRSVETNPECRPRLSNLRDSGQIEEAADVVAFVYRAEYYKKDSEELKGLAEVIIEKGRNIGIATIHTGFNARLTEFTDLSIEKIKSIYNYNNDQF